MLDWTTLCVVVSLFLSLTTVAGFILHSGLLSHVIVLTGSPPVKKLTFAYKFKVGPYKDCGQLLKQSHGIGPKLSCIAIFYDDPKKVPGPQCRYAAGSILGEGENKADEELLRSYETSGFNVFSFPEVTHVVTTSFPRRAFFSTPQAVRRVYPQLEQYIKERRLCAHPFLEIHQVSQIQFMVPLARQGDFYVPEVRPERKHSGQEDAHSDSDVSGADSTSEYSSGSGMLLSDSRETSVHSGHREPRESSAGGASFRELVWDQPPREGEVDGEEEEEEEEEEQEERLEGHSDQKRPDTTTQDLWGVVGGEE